MSKAFERSQQGHFIEKPGGRCAIMQALRFHFNLRPKQIGELMGCSNVIASKVTLASPDQNVGIPWWQRQYKQEAIEAAQKLLQKCGISEE